MSTAFIIPCAINNSRDTELALNQVLHTLQSIHRVAPRANIALVEYSLKPLQAEQKNSLLEASSLLAEYQQTQRIQEIESQYDMLRADAVSAIASLAWFFGLCQRDNLFHHTKDIVILQAGATIDRTTLNSIEDNDNGKFIFSPPENTHHDAQAALGSTGMRFNTAIWSLPAEQLNHLVPALWQSLEHAFDRIQSGSYSDLGLALYKYIDSSEIFYIKNLCQHAFTPSNSN